MNNSILTLALSVLSVSLLIKLMLCDILGWCFENFLMPGVHRARC